MNFPLPLQLKYLLFVIIFLLRGIIKWIPSTWAFTRGKHFGAFRVLGRQQFYREM